MDDDKNPAKKIVSTEGLTFDDVLLLPCYSKIKRRDVDLSTQLHPSIRLSVPIISSPMDTVTEDKMAVALSQHGGLGIIHRNLDIDKQESLIKRIKNTKPLYRNTASLDKMGRLLVGAAVGIGNDFEKRVKKLASVETDVIVVDSGHGFTKFMINAVRFVKKQFPKTIVMAGNIATYDGALALVKAGADILRVGMGPGSICTTRIVTGMGVPQITAIVDAVRAALSTTVTVVADGGVRQIGDIAKALGFGADAVMLGSMLAHFSESPGRLVVIKGKKYKEYRGMGSVAAMKKGAAERYDQSSKLTSKQLIAEGIEGYITYKGDVSSFIYQVEGSLRSALYYLGAPNLKTFSENARFIKISSSGLFESHPHNVIIEKAGDNYMT